MATRVDELKKRYEENPRRFFAPLANEYRKAGDLDAAIDLCRMHLEEQPGHLSGHIVYGQALFESARKAEAKTVFESALTLDPENLIALRHLGDIAKSEGDAGSARHWYQRILEVDPRNDEATALIESLSQLTAAPTVVVEAPHAPPPMPNYAEQAAAPAAPVVDVAAAPVTAVPDLEIESIAASASPTPVVPAPVVPAEPSTEPRPIAAAAPRLSIGLMDLDLNLADATTPTIDIGSALDAEAPPPSEEMPPAVLEPAPTIDEGMTLVDAGELAPEIETAAMAGLEHTSLGDGAGEIEVHDTSFDAPVAEEPSMFGVADEAPSFGDSLDITASADVIDETPPRISLLDSLPVIDTGDAVSIGEPVTEPKPAYERPAEEPAAAVEAAETAAPAAPAPATASDFDALFGNAPISDVVVGGDASPATVDDQGFLADSFVGREPTDEVLAAAPDIATPPSPFVTETMAELYLQQGFREEALGVYRQLLAQNPDDHGLAERVRHLEHGTRSSLAIDSVSEEIEAAAVADELRRSGSIPTVPAEPAAPAPEVPAAEAPAAEVPAAEVPTAEVAPVAAGSPPIVEAPTGPAPIIEMIPEPVRASTSTPRFTPLVVRAVEAPEPVMEMVPEPVAPAPPPPAGPTARDVLSRIAGRRAVPGGGVTERVAAPATLPGAPPEVSAAAPAPAATAESPVAMQPAKVGEVPVAPGGSLDRLFGMSGIGAADEGAALVMAAAYGGVPAAPIKGEPTRRVADELSLDSVFKGDESGSPLGVQRQSTRLRFDQFFSGAEGGESAPVAPPPTPAAPGDDIAQFTDWLKGLKGT
ncbi:MAG: tetratricopeptide repeat protein [Gemmatimonadetes bacterium]|nr:tetratricopeptide repeat protein [Gemmatimonadota bacterium]